MGGPAGLGGLMPRSGVFSSLFVLLSVAALTAENMDHTNQNQSKDNTETKKTTFRILLLGESGTGKSATGNTILGETIFESSADTSPVTEMCIKESRDWWGRELVVIDSPGLFDTDHSHLQTAQKMGRCVTLSAPGPHAIVLVLRLGRRYTNKGMVRKIQDIFGKEVLRYTIVLFTGRDELEGESIHDIVRKSNKDLQELLEMCGNRYCAFNNKAEGWEREEQASELMAMIDKMVAQNGGASFSSALYAQTERMIQESEVELKKNYLTMLEKETEKLKREFERKKKQIGAVQQKTWNEKLMSFLLNPMSLFFDERQAKLEQLKQHVGEELRKKEHECELIVRGFRREAEERVHDKVWTKLLPLYIRWLSWAPWIIEIFF